ncbi:ATP-binding protein [Fervidibacillus albus]|uniref:AAA family ATPase n=1 Tax=Fervidibacillus albus TaxID=2980026 RepID=A0A9E8LSH8_9BACI|nr:AAA family ATPase [Fervidibacillus albus]WAA08721.1 AAA family ATPase [Fervidibacillus albus]
MKIKEITIYGYGKFELFSLKDLGSLQVIYGPNEAGKTTILSFIQSILFGFPLKNSHESRYEPKSHSKYGGQLVIELDDHQTVRIERVKGKATGDVTVTLENGTIGGEQLLEEILDGMDRQLFQGIYSFNIHGLQNVHKLKGEDLNRFLFSTSTIGTDRLMEAEITLEKEMERRFKKSGTKPEMNRKLAELKDIEKQLKRSQEQVDHYDHLVRRRDEIDNALIDYQRQWKQIDEDFIQKKEWNRLYPLLIQKRQLLENITELKDIRFPKDGRRRLEQLDSERLSVEKRMVSLTERKKQLEQEIEQLTVDETFIEMEETIEWFVEDLPNYQSAMEQKRAIDKDLEQLFDEENELTSKLDLGCAVDEVERFDVSFAVKDTIVELMSRKEFLKKQRQELDQRDEIIRYKLKEKKREITDLMEQKLPDEEIKKLNDIIEEEEKRQILEREKQWIEHRLNEWENENRKRNDGNARLTKTIGVIFLLFCTAAAFFFKFFEMAIAFFLSAIILMLVLLITGKRDRKKEYVNQNQSLTNQLEQIERDLDQWNASSFERKQAKRMLEKDREIERRVEIERMNYRLLEEQFEELTNDFETWESDWHDVEKELKKIGEMYYLKPNISLQHLPESFDYLERLKTIQIAKKRLKKQRQQWNDILNSREERIERLKEQLSIQGTSYQERVLYLKQKLVIEREQFRKRMERIEKKDELTKEINSLKEEIRFIDEKRSQLFQEAGTDSIDSFLEMEEKSKLRAECLEKMEWIDKQLNSSIIRIPESFQHLPKQYPDVVFSEMEEKKKELKKEIDRLERMRATVSYEIAQIEQGGVYSELLQQYHQTKYEFMEMAKSWAVYATAHYCLRQSMDKYKSEKLPKILKQASDYFQILTQRRYLNIYLDRQNDQLYVRRSDGLIFTPDELSQATGEQLYVSIRFALAKIVNQRKSYPLLIDDGFVHFDEQRLKEMMHIIKDLAKEQQIFFFTCHSSLLSFFEDEAMIQLS